MAQHPVALRSFNQGLLAVTRDDDAAFIVPRSLGRLLSALRLYSARLLVGEATFGHRDSVCHSKPCRSQLCGVLGVEGEKSWRSVTKI